MLFAKRQIPSRKINRLAKNLIVSALSLVFVFAIANYTTAEAVDFGPKVAAGVCSIDNPTGCTSAPQCEGNGGVWYPAQTNENGRIEKNASCDFAQERCSVNGGSWVGDTSYDAGGRCDYTGARTTCERSAGKKWDSATSKCISAPSPSGSSGSGGATTGGGLDLGSLPQTSPSTGKTGTLGRVFNLVIGLLAVIAVLIIVLAGFRYITSAGDANGVASARKAIIYSAVGLIVAGAAWTIVTFVLGGL